MIKAIAKLLRISKPEVKPKLNWPTSERALQELKRLKAGERGGLYMGGTLSVDIDDFATAFHVHGKHNAYKDGENHTIPDTPEIRKLVCELYIENKTPTHAYYRQAMEVLTGVKA
jgi:hypothetical protein